MTRWPSRIGGTIRRHDDFRRNRVRGTSDPRSAAFVLPALAAADREEQKRYAQELADAIHLARTPRPWSAWTSRTLARDRPSPEADRGVVPLDAINRASAREKLIRHGHPSTLHLWWARRPLAACRAVLFAQLVDDPSAWPEEFPTEEDQERERARLNTIIAEMVPWVATHEPRILNKAQFEIACSLARAP